MYGLGQTGTNMANIDKETQTFINEYKPTEARVLAFIMVHYQDTYQTNYNFLMQYNVHKGLKIYGKKGKEAALKEMKQLHDRTVFEPITRTELNELEKKRAME